MNTYRTKQFFLSLEKFNKITKHQRDVLLTLLSFFGKDGCYPSHAKIAEEANVSERTVRNALKEARLRGWIDWTNKWTGRFQSSNHYRITVSSKYINKILNHIRDFKNQDAKIRDFFRRQQVPRSPYYYIKKQKEKLWIRIKEPEISLSAFQKLSIEDQIRQLQSI